ncbi:MAG: flagellar hook protein [Deltaproteobacteria bacterium]|nr:flagellar hook protein [Deltaproteobacteria bacterium]
MSSAMYIAVTGLNATSRQLDVIGNNVTNSQTMGYKAGRMYFANVLSQNLTTGTGAGIAQVGQGVMIADIATQWTQGALETTGSALDMAIDGEGFFIVEDSESSRYYTRAGAFRIDEDGYVIDTNGYRVQGYDYFSATPNSIGDINVRNAHSEPAVTTEFQTGMNLNADTETDGTFVSALTVYDSLGAQHSLSITFTKNAAVGTWDFAADLDGVAATAQSDNQLVFDADGNMVGAADVTFTFAAPANGAEIGTAGVVNWDIEGVTAEAVTGYASNSVVRTIYADGYPAGFLRSVAIGKDGTVSGFFTNAQTVALGQVQLASFANTWELDKIGNNLFSETLLSGQAVINAPTTAGLGGLISNSLEQSNTDLSTEFVNMITAQRAYQACTKIITTTDAMLDALMSVKR